MGVCVARGLSALQNRKVGVDEARPYSLQECQTLIPCSELEVVKDHSTDPARLAPMREVKVGIVLISVPDIFLIYDRK